MESSPEELALVRRARDRGPDGARAYAELVVAHQAWLLRHLTFVLGSRCAAEDATQEALVRAYLALDRAPPTRSFRAWLRVIATRLALNYRRNELTRKRYEQLAAPVQHDAPAAWEDVDHVDRLMGGLSDGSRHLLLLRYMEDFSVTEVADTLGIGVSAAKMRLKRAREALRQKNRDLGCLDHASATALDS